MTTAQQPHSILVPVVDGDISEAALARGRSLLVGSDAQLVLVHIMKKPVTAHEDAHHEPRARHTAAPRWRELARAAHGGRVFVEVLEGDPARIIAAEAERFHSDVIVLDESVATPARPAGRALLQSTPTRQAVC